MRGSAVASLSTGVALLFHLIGGGAMPAAMGLVAPLILSAFIGMLVMTARPRFFATLTVTAVAQVAFHALFTLGSSPSAAASMPAAAHAMHAGHAMPAAPTAASALPEASSAVVGIAGDTRMWLMHALAAIVTAVVLHRGELILTALSRLLARVVAPVLPAVPATHPLAPALRTWVDSIPRAHAARILLHVAPDRGPPLLLAA